MAGPHLAGRTSQKAGRSEEGGRPQDESKSSAVPVKPVECAGQEVSDSVLVFQSVESEVPLEGDWEKMTAKRDFGYGKKDTSVA